MQIERGRAGTIPYAAVGSGPPVLVAAGLWPTTGVDSDRFVRAVLAPLQGLAASRRLIVVNRRSQLPTDLSIAGLAGEYAAAVHAEFGAPIDVVGTSTGGTIAQQLAADHPDTVRRLVLLSAACRLGPTGRDLSLRVAAKLRADRPRDAIGLLAASLAPPGLRALSRVVAQAVASLRSIDESAQADLAATLEAETQFDLQQCAEPIRATTLIIAGARDRFYSPELFRETAALIPASQLRLFPRRGHITVVSDRRARATVAGFLGRP